jgi:hypothetical protein
MLLITMYAAWPSGAARPVSFVTNLTLNASIHRIRAYEECLRQRAGQQSPVFDLIAVATIEDLDATAIKASGAMHVETLPQSLDELNTTTGSMVGSKKA